MYDHIAPSYDQLHAAEQQRKFSLLTTNIHLDEYVRIADIGCATAHLHKYFSVQRYLGVEPSAPLLKQAPETVTTICAPGENIPLPDNSSDLVISLTALHNYDDPVRGVAELARICSDTALIGVLKKSPQSRAIIEAIHEEFSILEHIDDQHDDLFVASVRNV